MTERKPEEDSGPWVEEESASERMGGGNGEPLPELSEEVVRQITATLTHEREDPSPNRAPREPRTFVEVGLSKAFLTDLTLRTMHYSGSPTAVQLMQRLGLRQSLVQQLIASLIEERLCEVARQSDLYTGNYHYRLSERGLARVREALERTRYAGSVPVTADQYTEVMRKQQEPRQQSSLGKLKEAMGVPSLVP